MSSHRKRSDRTAEACSKIKEVSPRPANWTLQESVTQRMERAEQAGDSRAPAQFGE
jgi:hypothetical protein